MTYTGIILHEMGAGMRSINDNNLEIACDKRRYEISRADLPLSCPPRDTRVWDAHPRVYLPIEETGDVVCPYCGAEYVLKDFIPPES